MFYSYHNNTGRIKARVPCITRISRAGIAEIMEFDGYCTKSSGRIFNLRAYLIVVHVTYPLDAYRRSFLFISVPQKYTTNLLLILYIFGNY